MMLSSVPEQLSPLPVYPVRQTHENDPTVLLHRACWSQGRDLHSSISKTTGKNL